MAVRDEGIGETKDNLEDVEDSMEDTADAAGNSAEELQEFSERFEGALGAAVAAFSIATAGLLTQVPVIGEVFAGLGAVIDAFAFRLDGVLRPALNVVTAALFEFSNIVLQSEGPLGLLFDAIAALVPLVGAGGALLLGVAKLGALIGTFASTAAGLSAILGGLVSAFGSLSAISGVLVTLLDAIGVAIVGLASVLGIGAVAAAGLVAAVGALVAVFATDFLGIRTKTVNAIKGLIDWFTDLASDIAGAAGDVASAAADIATSIADELVSLVDDALDWGQNLVTNIGNGIINMIDGAIGAAGRIYDDVKDEIVDLVDDALVWGEDMIEKFVEGVQNKVGWAAEQVKGAFDDITPSIKFDLRENDEMAQEWGSDMIQHFARGATEQASSSDVPLPASGGGGSLFRSGGSGSGAQIDGRQLSESTGRYRADPARRRGL